MPGWSHHKRVVVEKAFYQFLNKAYINSKDKGRICLGSDLYWGQRWAITQIFDALEQDIHKIYILKSRQLGISTLIRALVTFLLGINKGMKGAIVFDTDTNKNLAREQLEVMINDLPSSLKFPDIKTNNRAGLTLVNNSIVLFMSAGVRQSKTSGTLGRSQDLAFAHCSELCSWDNDEGFEAFEQSLSDINPDRLYIYESTARGYNHWQEMWSEARLDTPHCKCIFLGWWAKDSQRLERNTQDFKFYGEQPLSEKEKEKIAKVKELYKVDVSMEQVAWIRRKMNPAAWSEEHLEEALEFEGTNARIAEQPWTEDEAFQQTGAVFFSPEVLTEMTSKYVSKKYQRYMFMAGSSFTMMKAYRSPTPRNIELKVWEEPDASDGYYVLGIDPAYGVNEKNDRSCIQVLRCFADGVDQVAEYAWPLITTQQLAWVIAAIMGWYGQNNNTVRYVLEIQGPGMAVFNELKGLRFQIENDRSIRDEVQEKGLFNIFKNVKTYVYTRPDSMGAGYNYHILTHTRLKRTLLERLRDHMSRGIVRVRSLECVEEMNKMQLKDDDIAPSGGKNHDDRVMALAFAVHCWEEKEQRGLISNRLTRAADVAKKQQSIVDQVALFNRNHLEGFLNQQKAARAAVQRAESYRNWRYGSRRY
jgi:hypothetical protein